MIISPSLIGWSWEPVNRPSFETIHCELNTMFSSTNVEDGKLVEMSILYSLSVECIDFQQS